MPLSYRPAGWLRGSNLMTVAANVTRPFPRPRGWRQRWELPDGDFLDVDRFAGSGPGAPVLVVCHGLEGSSRSPYVRGIVSGALRRGLAALALNFRGCSGELNRLPRFYHSGETGDLALVVDRLAAERPGRPLLLAGFSLGGNVVVKYLGERGGELPPEVAAAAVVSVPFDLVACARTLDGPGFWRWLYRERFLRQLRHKALRKAHRFPGSIDAAAVRSARTFSEYDAALTAPLHGFASAEDYWIRCSSARFLSGVRRPLLCLSAADDPMIPAESLPVPAASRNPFVSLEVLSAGGHVAFVSGPPWRPRFWAEERSLDFLVASLSPVGPR